MDNRLNDIVNEIVNEDPRASHYRMLQKRIAQIFENVGYKVDYWPPAKELHFDLELSKEGKQYVFALKECGSVYVTVQSVLAAARYLMNDIFYPLNGKIPILVLLGVTSAEVREALAAEYPQLVVVDIGNILYMTQGNEELRNRFISLLSFSVESVQPQKPGISLEIRSDEPQKINWGEYNSRLSNWNPKRDKSAAYEHLCSGIMDDLFAEDLTPLKKQQRSNNGLFRFDAIAKIKRGNNKEFWETIEKYYNSKYVVFEYKNYSDKITQAQVYTTVRYLYATALRRVAILISTNGADDHANIAIRGILRDEGKLIIALSNADLIEMLKRKRIGQDPADYLSCKLDELLIDLEK